MPNEELIAHVNEMRATMAWMLALIDGGEQMPKPDDEISEAMRLCLTNTQSLT